MPSSLRHPTDKWQPPLSLQALYVYMLLENNIANKMVQIQIKFSLVGLANFSYTWNRSLIDSTLLLVHFEATGLARARPLNLHC